MGETEERQIPQGEPTAPAGNPTLTQTANAAIERKLSPQAGASCPTCGSMAESSGGMATASYVYAIGRIEPRFPRASVEKEYAQVRGQAETVGLTDRQAVHKVLSDRHNRYLVL